MIHVCHTFLRQAHQVVPATSGPAGFWHRRSWLAIDVKLANCVG